MGRFDEKFGQLVDVAFVTVSVLILVGCAYGKGYEDAVVRAQVDQLSADAFRRQLDALDEVPPERPADKRRGPRPKPGGTAPE